MMNGVLPLRKKIREKNPLIHCITNPISINDCANIILAVGAKPIMAEHPQEVGEITAGADALCLNLGNITDLRMESMRIAAGEAKRRRIPIVLDLVGVACSRLRLDFAASIVAEYHPQVIKGNRSEIAALWEKRLTARGVDAEGGTFPDAEKLAATTRDMADRWQAVVMITGPVDIVSTPEYAALCHNGHPMLGELTGTGCMLGALTAAFASVGDQFDAAFLAVLTEGICGEAAAEHTRGIGSFRADFFDALYHLADDTLIRRARWEEMK